MGVAEFVKQHRLAKKFKRQEDLSDRCYIAQGHLSRIESGLTDPQDVTLKKLALGLDVSYLQIYTAVLSESNMEQDFIDNMQEIYNIDVRIKKGIEDIFTRILDGDMALRVDFIEKFSSISSHYGRVIDSHIEKYFKESHTLDSKKQLAEIEAVRATCVIIEKRHFKPREEISVEFEKLLNKESEQESDSFFEFNETPLILDNTLMTEKEKYITVQLIRAVRNTNLIMVT